MRVILLAGGETRFHRFEEVVPPLTATIGSAGHSCQALHPEVALRLDVLRHTDAIVSVTTGGKLSQAQEAALLDSIRAPLNDRGGAVHFLGLHGASCSFSNSIAYSEMLGGRFVSHPEAGTFRVKVRGPHQVTDGVQDFDIEDERYCLELVSEVECLLSHTPSDPSQPEQTLGWVRQYGAGRICYIALGHGRAQLQHPSVRQLLTQALTWFEA